MCYRVKRPIDGSRGVGAEGAIAPPLTVKITWAVLPRHLPPPMQKFNTDQPS
jgi:hypothetical protein